MDKDFNTYKEGLDLEILQRYCMEHGTEKTFQRGEALESEGHQSHWLFVGDFPNCMDYQFSCVSIVAQTTSKVFLIDGKESKNLFETNKLMKDKTSEIYKHLFLQIYSQHLDSYRLTMKERYTQLLRRCPQIVQQINLKDIASFLRVTPTTISKIRKEITFSI